MVDFQKYMDCDNSISAYKLALKVNQIKSLAKYLKKENQKASEFVSKLAEEFEDAIDTMRSDQAYNKELYKQNVELRKKVDELQNKLEHSETKRQELIEWQNKKTTS